VLLMALTSGSIPNAADVYHCDSPDAKKYHLTDNCRGLNACKHEIKPISLANAKARGLTLCGWED